MKLSLSITTSLSLGLFLLVYPAAAQTKLSGILECSPPRFFQLMTVGDRLGHTMAMSQRQCGWTKPLTIGTAFSRDGVLSLFTDARPAGFRDRGYEITMMSNGDEIYMQYAGIETNASGASSSGGNFTLSGGSGKFQSIYGRGSVSSHLGKDSSLTIVFTGEYTIAPQ
jgi:hypothetical protein